jgi:hypothetical protein
VTDKQFEVLVGISRSMEKSLENIEKSMSEKSSGGKSGKTSKAAGALGGLAGDLQSIVAAVSVKMFDEDKGAKVISFSRELVQIANDINPASAKAFGQFADGLSKAFETIFEIMNPGKLIKLFLASKILFEGKKPLIKRIVEGMTNAFEGLDARKAKQGSEAIQALGEGLLSLTKALKGFILIGLAAPLVAMGALVVRGVISLFSGFGKNAKMIEEGGQALKSLGKGLMWFSAGLATVLLITLVASPEKVMGAIALLAVFGLTFWALGKASESIRLGAKAVAFMGLALFGFAAALATFMLVLLIVKPAAILMGLVVISAFALVFYALGKASTGIAEGALAMYAMGIGLAFFSLALFGFGFIIKLYDIETLFMGALLIAEMGLAMYMLGKFSKQITEGAIVMAEMGVGLGLFAIGALIFGLAIKLYDLESIVIGAALIAGLGLAFAVVGLVAPEVFVGAIAVAEMGAALIPFGLGLIVFGVAIKIIQALFDDLSEAGKIAGGIIVGLGLAFALVGAMSAAVIPGATAVGAMGGALIVFSVGLVIFGVAIKILQAMFDDLKEAGTIAGAIILGFGLAFAAVGLLGIPIILGAAAMTTVGVSLVVLSVGLMIFAGAVKLLTKVFGSDIKKVGEQTFDFLMSMGLAFSGIGLLIIPITLGSASVILMGASLISLGAGLVLFGLGTSMLLKSLGTTIDKAGEQMKSFLVGLGMAFSEIGMYVVPIVLGSAAMLTLGASLLVTGGALLVFGYAMNYLNEKGLLVDDGDGGTTIKGLSVLLGAATAVADVGILALNPFFWSGIAASVGLGASLLVIGLGLQEAAKALNEVKDMDKLISGIFGDDGLIPVMAKQFADIGDKYGGGLLSSFLGTDSVSMGIRVTRGFGDVLQELAGGIVAFANFSEFPVKVPDPKDPSNLIYQTVDIFSDIIPALNENLPTLLSSLATTFAEIGEKYGGDSGWFGEDSPVQKGVSAVKGLGTVLSEVAGGIIAFAQFEEFPVQVPDPKDPSKLIYKTVNLFDALPKIKEALIGDGSLQGKLTGKTGILMGLAEVFAEIGNKYGDGFLSDGPVKKGVEAVQGIGGVVSELAEGIVAFANMKRGLPNYDEKGKFNGTYTPFSLEDVKNNITSVINTLPSVFAGVDIDAMDAAKEKANAAVPLAEAISRVGKALQELVVDKKGKEKESLVALIGPGINAIVNDTKNIEIDGAKILMLKELGKALQEFIGLNDGLSGLSDTLTKTGKSLVDFGGYLNNVPDYVSKIDSLTTSLGPGGAAIVGFGNNLVTFSASVDTAGINEDKIGKLMALQTVLSSFTLLTDPITMLAQSLNALASSFISFGKGFSAFADQPGKAINIKGINGNTGLIRFTAFELLMSDLSKNSHMYNTWNTRFKDFTGSVGTLKENINAFEIQHLEVTAGMIQALATISAAKNNNTVEIVKNAMKEITAAVDKIVVATGQQQGTFEKLGSDINAGVNNLLGKPAAPTKEKEAPSPGLLQAMKNVETAINNLKGVFDDGVGGSLRVEVVKSAIPGQ